MDAMPPRFRLLALLAWLCTLAADAAPARPGVCDVLQAHLQAGTLNDLRIDTPLSLALQGRRATLTFRSEGTGLVPNLVVTDANTGEAFDPGLGDLAGDVRGDAFIIRVAGRHHVLFMERGNGTGNTVPLEGGESCTAERTRVESVAPTSAEPAVCRRILSGRGIAEVEFKRPLRLDDDALEQRWGVSPMGAQAVASATLDIANDGHPVQVARLTGRLRMPDTCSVQLHDLLSADGARLANDAERRALQARGIVGDDPSQWDADCYHETHYLLDGQRVLIEMREHEASDEAKPSARSVSVAERGRVRPVCDITFADRWSVTPAAPGGAPR
jgi:hypothetical protein